MFKKTNRLNRGEFEVFFNSGKRFHHPTIQLITTFNPTLKVAVVVPKKVVKTAVGRNRIRRQLYHQLKNILKDRTGVFIFIVKKPWLDTTLEERQVIIKSLVGVITKSR